METRAMEIRSAADASTVRARSEWFTGTVWQDPLLEAPEPARVKVVRVTLDPEHAQPGTLIHSVERCTCSQAWDARRPGVAQCASFVLATQSGFRQARSTGTEQPQPSRWFISRSTSTAMASTWTGSRPSPTRTETPPRPDP